MLIGIDASRIVTNTPTGTETYSREMTRALLEIDHANRYRLYSRDRMGIEWSELGAEVRCIPFPRMWTHVRLSTELLLSPPDLLFIPAHVIPPVHPNRTVVTVHDLGFLHFPEAHPTNQRLYHISTAKWNARAAVHVFADSEATRDDLVHFSGIEPGRVSVVYPAYDAERFHSKADEASVRQMCARLRIDNDYVLAVGTIHPRKNYDRLIRAFGKTHPANRQLVIVGKRGWQFEDIFRRVSELGLENRVRFLDYVLPDDLALLYSGALLLAFPSLYEGFGLPVLEAQACGTPVVCSMTSSLPEVAGDGAVFVDPCDVDALGGAIERVTQDQDLRNKLVRNGKENVKRFSWKASAAKALAIFERYGNQVA